MVWVLGFGFKFRSWVLGFGLGFLGFGVLGFGGFGVLGFGFRVLGLGFSYSECRRKDACRVGA